MNVAPPLPPARANRLAVAALVLAISLVAAAAVPELQRRNRDARARELAADLQAARDAFQAYAHQKGDWPAADAGPGEPPTGMAEPLSATRWRLPTPIGGHYAWKLSSLHQGQRYAAAIVVTGTDRSPVHLDREALLQLDRQLDDGDLAAGNLRLGFRNQPLLVLEH